MKTVFTVSFFVCMMLIASIAWSEIVYVNGTTGDDATGERGNPDKPFKTIQKGIDVAVSGEDTVLVADGTYTGEGNKNLDFKGKAITVTSENGAESTIIDCEDNGRGFYFNSGEDSSSVVSGFTIINGNIDGHGAGGGIYCYNSSPTITNNIITENYAWNGGGIYCEKSSPIIRNNIIMNNAAWVGDGIHCGRDSSCEIANNTITDNRGEGIYCGDWSSPKITNNTITWNDFEGIECHFSSSAIMITNNGIHNNSGDGIYCYSSDLVIINNTLVENKDRGLNGYKSSLMVLNTILWSNTLEEIRAYMSTITVTYSDIQGGWEGEGNIDADPLFVDPDNGDYHLQAGSPCIDAGDPNSPKDPDGTRADMGAYYFDQSAPLPGDVSGNGSITAYDAALILQYIVGLKELSEKEQDAADVTGDGTVTALDAALILQYTVGLITQFPVQQGAPILAAKDENRVLTKIIAELENVPLTTEQKSVLEQLKHLIGQQSIPEHTSLLQNYPNPFNPETWLPYQLAQDASVTISIYNVKGRLLRTLHLGNKNAGVYVTKDKSAQWDGRDSLGQSVASGLYFYTLQVEHPDEGGAGTFTATRKMVIVK